MKYKECDSGFCRKTDCWSHHVAYGGFSMQPKKGTRRRLPNREDDENDNNNYIILLILLTSYIF